MTVANTTRKLTGENLVSDTEPKVLVAADLLKEKHPLHNAFKAWCGEKELTKRQASKFLAAYPAYRTQKTA
jgi:hypothetical protein